jgi:iron-sulfur cluster assembly accessory protein
MLARCARRFAAFNLTDAAAAQVKRLLEGDFENRMLRVGLATGGCSGFQYDFGFEAKPKPGDQLFEKNGAKVVLDQKALLFLRGATLDFVSDPFRSSFQVNLPEASTLHNCSCGRSVGTEHNPGQCTV